MTETETPMDRHAIVAEIHRRGTSLRKLAKAADLEASACCMALSRGHRAGEQAIADFLGISPATLWPDRYPSSSQGEPTPTKAGSASPKAAAATDKRRAA
ncbi:helix-turn-helix domain-containing protein [Amorphus coralli]|uniref:helix-turn-helix domain-containing protein n=1 Tax=Amorphus coralli TaxID=340680 RepID=UPI00036466F0|nr:helix-turn-helix domain-containing protein [Amorphus coralli]